MQPTTQARILIVEDDARLRAIVASGLRGRGYRVREAGTLAEARALLDAALIDIAIVDLNLPDGSGWDLVRQARQRPGPRTIVASAAETLQPPGPDAAPDAILRKPFAVDTLARLIEHAAGVAPEAPHVPERRLT